MCQVFVYMDLYNGSMAQDGKIDENGKQDERPSGR
jgi:hypothetical protein